MEYSQWRGWFPGAIDDRGAIPEVRWRHVGQTRFVEPFFEGSFGKAAGHERRSGWETVGEVACRCENVEPTGLVFHMSRCGSTLVAQMLAASARNIVLSEVPSIDAALRAQVWEPSIDDGTKIDRLRQLVRVLGQRRFADEANLFIKFDAWSITELPLIHEAFPDVPWLFLYRDPVEVLVSHQRRPGMHMVPGLLKGIPFDNAPKGLGHAEYGPWLLREIGRAALRHRTLGQGMFVDYARLPDFVTSQLPGFFDIELSATERRQMDAVAAYHAKAPINRFEGDSSDKQAAATSDIRTLAEQWLGDVWRALKASE